MATFPRTRIPDRASSLWLPTGLRDRGHTGIIQVRTTKQVGWSWEESWKILNARSNDDAELMALINYYWNRMEAFDIVHPIVRGSGLAPGGTGTGSVLVMGGSQVGGSVITDGWPISTSNVVRAGDVIKFAGDVAVYQIRESANSNGSGQATLKIVPHLRKSPADNAPVTTTGVTFQAMIWERSQYEPNQNPSYFADMRVVFTEFLS